MENVYSNVEEGRFRNIPLRTPSEYYETIRDAPLNNQSNTPYGIRSIYKRIRDIGQGGSIDENMTAIINTVMIYNREITDYPSSEERDIRYINGAVNLTNIFPDILDADQSIVANLHPIIYRLYFYYNLDMINDRQSTKGWFNIPAVLTEDGKRLVRDVDRILNDYGQYITTFNYENSGNFGLKVVYSDVISEQILQFPFSEAGHRYIYDTINSNNKLRYDNAKVTEEGMQKTIYNDTSLTYYDTIEDIPLIDLLMDIDIFSGTGIYGRTFSIQFADSIPMFGKIDKIDKMSILHEYRVGLELNKHYSSCPFVMYTYGLASIRMELLSDTYVGYVPVGDNESEYTTIDRPREDGTFDTSATVEYEPMLLTQWISGSMSLLRFLEYRNRLRCQEIGSNGEIIDISFEEGLMKIICAVLTTLRYLHHELEFTHNDLHLNNIQIMPVDHPVVIKLPGSDMYFNLNYVPILIDFGRVCIKKYDFLPHLPNTTIHPYDARINTDQNYVNDVNIFIMSLFMFHNDLQNELSINFWNDLTGFVFGYMNGIKLADISHIETMRNMYIYLNNRWKENGIQINRRILPLGMSTYDPDGAIDELLLTWSSVLRSNGNINIEGLDYDNINQKISDRIGDGPIIIDNYSSASIMNQEGLQGYPKELDIQSISDSIVQRIDKLNNFEILNDSDDDNVKRQLIYRRELNNKVGYNTGRMDALKREVDRAFIDT